jgi:CheY-like chemotaxis protein
VLDLNEVVAENLKMLTRMIGEDIDLVMVPDPALGAVRADPGQIDQVIMNLAVNARDAMPQGGKLTIVTSNVSLDENFARTHTPLIPGEYVMIAISDTGVGMDRETQTHIFEPFFTTKGSKGTGLGLSTVYGIVKQSGGFIFVDSEPHRGTAFRAYFPRIDGREDAAAAQESLGLPRPERGQETILIVEDEVNLRRLARQYLERQGYKILEAEDGAAALQIVDGHEGAIDLLLTDVIMPGMNGRELAAQVVKLLPNIRVLYMSGYAENAVGHDGTIDAGINLLQKPFSLPALKDRVRELLDSEPIPPEIAISSRSAADTLEKKMPPFRARRFNLQLPLRYRPLGEKSWHPGTTENISRSGMLFHGEEMLHPNAQLEISLVLPAEIAGLAATEVICRGEVVRLVEAHKEGQSVTPALAAKILQYHFQHGARVGEA